MKTKFKLLLIILSISIPAISQDFTFVYDDVGNRTDRFITLSPPSKATMQDTSFVDEEILEEEETTEEQKLHDKLGSFNLVVYPNPTKGEVVVQISGEENLGTVTYKVFDRLGREILSGAKSSNVLQINLSGQKAGAYFLCVEIYGKEKSWKIVKE
ncbi:MAG: T9SS type A sorting domain-containing protein [Bacteroidetes bacterium]|nr:T9SS type A sorting domain-containing protein [Bacteroidota bacterium]MBT6686575.1 T9SS type A sorting domain-containing protein [Bacteroidota bacterium]MBT7142938.1 T9SS type A sorting domain-containing protein [Bacteroidota bacterium]MBT7490613.1 T9SS type A sorting domain-containing protein [Bacteroidota bacterium]